MTMIMGFSFVSSKNMLHFLQSLRRILVWLDSEWIYFGISLFSLRDNITYFLKIFMENTFITLHIPHLHLQIQKRISDFTTGTINYMVVLLLFGKRKQS